MTITHMEQFNQFFETLLAWMTGIAPRVIGAIFILVVGWWLARVLSKATRKAMTKAKLDAGIVSFTYSIVKTVLRSIVVIAGAAQMGVNVTSIVAAIGAVSVTIGLALKDSLANLASGALIIINKPFHVGDYLEVEKLEGTVTKIEMTFTTLTTYDNKTIIVPNSRLTSNNIVNYTAQNTRRLDLNYTVSYRDNIAKVKALLNDMVTQNEKIMQQPAPIIAVTEHKTNGINFAVKIWCASSDYWDLYCEMQEKVITAFDENGITIPYNHTDIHIVK